MKLGEVIVKLLWDQSWVFLSVKVITWSRPDVGLRQGVAGSS